MRLRTANKHRRRALKMAVYLAAFDFHKWRVESGKKTMPSGYIRRAAQRHKRLKVKW